jgi:hypothetical protein
VSNGWGAAPLGSLKKRLELAADVVGIVPFSDLSFHAGTKVGPPACAPFRVWTSIDVGPRFDARGGPHWGSPRDT